MKKHISIMLSIIILFSTVTIGFTGYAQEIEKQAVSNFADECLEIVTEHDANQAYEVVEEDVDEYDDLQFQTARLYIKCSSAFNKMGAEEVVGGFLDWHLLQFESPKQAKEAYAYYQSLDKIECVEPDVPTEVDVDVSEDIVFATKDEFKNCYAYNIMGINQVLPYIKNNNIKTAEVKVAILDTGIDYNHELFDDRIFRTYFNATNSGDINDEYDIENADAHGTSTVSCVVSCTPETVKTGCYKTLASSNETTQTKNSWIQTALLKAYDDNCEIISMSFSIETTQLLLDTFEYLYDNGVTMFASSGNKYSHTSYSKDYDVIFTQDTVVSVGASDIDNYAADFSNTGYHVDFFAPGVDIVAAYPNNQYIYTSGTSFSSPYAAGIYATLVSLNTNFSREKIIDLMCYTCQDIITDAIINDVWYGHEWYGAGVLDALGAFCEMMNIERISPVKINIPNFECRTTDKIELTCNTDNVQIYYTTDGTFPTKENAKLYTKDTEIHPFGLTKIMAIAYREDMFHSQNQYMYCVGFELGTDDMFTITNDGEIIHYLGDVSYLEIPETINGITVRTLHPDLFTFTCKKKHGDEYGFNSTVPLKGVKLPDTVEYLEDMRNRGLFIGNDQLEYFSANNLKEIQDYMFYLCTNLVMINIPNAVNGGKCAFYKNENLYTISLPNLESAEEDFIARGDAYYIWMPKLKTYEGRLLYHYGFILDMDLSNLTTSVGETRPCLFGRYDIYSLDQLFLPNILTIEKRELDELETVRLEFSKLKSLKSLPIGGLKLMTPTEVRHILLPSTLKEIDNSLAQEYKNNFVFYGTKGSFAEYWCNENDLTFIELNQNSAIFRDVRDNCNKYTETLLFDSYGFNKTYQWYGSFEKSTDNGIAIKGATTELINLHDYDSYPYYYCVCTSTDIDGDFQHQELIYSSICENVDYQSADYTEYNKAVEQANSLNKELYENFSVVEDALLVDVSNKSVEQQNVVDAQTQAILNAISNLKLKETTTQVETTTEIETTTQVETTTQYESSTTEKATTSIEQTTIKPKPTNKIEPSSELSESELTTKHNEFDKSSDKRSPLTGSQQVTIIISCEIVILGVMFFVKKRKKRCNI